MEDEKEETVLPSIESDDIPADHVPQPIRVPTSEFTFSSAIPASMRPREVSPQVLKMVLASAAAEAPIAGPNTPSARDVVATVINSRINEERLVKANMAARLREQDAEVLRLRLLVKEHEKVLGNAMAPNNVKVVADLRAENAELRNRLDQTDHDFADAKRNLMEEKADAKFEKRLFKEKNAEHEAELAESDNKVATIAAKLETGDRNLLSPDVGLFNLQISRMRQSEALLNKQIFDLRQSEGSLNHQIDELRRSVDNRERQAHRFLKKIEAYEAKLKTENNPDVPQDDSPAPTLFTYSREESPALTPAELANLAQAIAQTSADRATKPPRMSPRPPQKPLSDNMDSAASKESVDSIESLRTENTKLAQQITNLRALNNTVIRRISLLNDDVEIKNKKISKLSSDLRGMQTNTNHYEDLVHQLEEAKTKILTEQEGFEKDLEEMKQDKQRYVALAERNIVQLNENEAQIKNLQKAFANSNKRSDFAKDYKTRANEERNKVLTDLDRCMYDLKAANDTIAVMREKLAESQHAQSELEIVKESNEHFKKAILGLNDQIDNLVTQRTTDADEYQSEVLGLKAELVKSRRRGTSMGGNWSAETDDDETKKGDRVGTMMEHGDNDQTLLEDPRRSLERELSGEPDPEDDPYELESTGMEQNIATSSHSFGATGGPEVVTATEPTLGHGASAAEDQEVQTAPEPATSGCAVATEGPGDTGTGASGGHEVAGATRGPVWERGLRWILKQQTDNEETPAVGQEGDSNQRSRPNYSSTGIQCDLAGPELDSLRNIQDDLPKRRKLEASYDDAGTQAEPVAPEIRYVDRPVEMPPVITRVNHFPIPGWFFLAMMFVGLLIMFLAYKDLELERGQWIAANQLTRQMTRVAVATGRPRGFPFLSWLLNDHYLEVNGHYFG